jgi:hypothetical protein
MSEVWRHKKTGGLYEALTSARMESDGIDGKRYVVYRGLKDGYTWIRPADEFFDGRFELTRQSP